MTLRPTQISAILAILENRPVVFRCHIAPDNTATPGNGGLVAECDGYPSMAGMNCETGAPLPETRHETLMRKCDEAIAKCKEVNARLDELIRDREAMRSELERISRLAKK